jgi:ABC-type antimicrobial peptide transport system permease subunit
MFKNYFRVAWRNLYRNKLHTAINLGGLIIGFTIGIIILLVVYAQFTFDNFHEHRKRIYEAYQVINKTDGQEITNLFGFAPAPVYKKESSVIERATRITDGGNHVEYKGKDLVIPVAMVDEDFFPMFSFPILKGNRSNPLANLSDVVLSEDAVKKIFGNEDPIGKTIKASAGESMQKFIVTAVVKNFTNSSINFEIVTRIENRSNYPGSRNNWNDRSPNVYIELKKGATSMEAEGQLRQIDRKYVPEWYDDLAKKGLKADQSGDVMATRLLPLSEVHFSTRVNGHRAISSMQMLTILTVGLLIIFIACFNYVNINLSNIFTRSREIGVRKCMGASRWKLFLQLWSESFLVCIIAFIVSLLLVHYLLHSITGFEPLKISVQSVIWQPVFLLLAFALLFFVSLVAGGYPSWLMIRLRVVETLKGKISLKRNSVLRSSLIVMQFVIACIMISSTFIIYRQFKYLQNADTGIDKDYVISVLLHNPGKGSETIEKLRGLLANDPRIISISGSNINMGRGSDHRTVKSTTDFTVNNQTIRTNVASVDYDYLKTFGVKLLEGREFSKAFGTDTINSVVISQSVAEQFHDKNLVGKTVGADSSSRGWHIVGIFNDFHLYTLEEKLEPLTLTISKDAPLYYGFVKTTSLNPVASMESVKKAMSVLEPGQEFNASFVNENINDWYQAEKMMSVLFSIAAAVAIVLSCSGLLAMVLLIVQQRVKEIGVRKVLGASVQNISLLISKEFLYLVVIAILIATPLAWIVMNQWLNGFPYRIHIQLWMFVVVAFTALIIAMTTIAVNTIRAAMQNPVTSLRSE